jgi:arylsulfatase A-like enzyme
MRNLKRRTVVLLTGLLVLLALAGLSDATAQSRRSTGTSNQASGKPNIILIMGDDLGYADTGLYGNKDIPTPNIDSIAKSGVLFPEGYVTAPVCSPSRAALMTGRYQQRFGFEFNAGPLQRAVNNKEMGLPTSEITMPDLLKKAGYKTGMVGKWHLGMHPKFHPKSRGFDEYFGFLFGANTYIDPKTEGVSSIGGNEGPAWPRNPQNLILKDQSPVEESEYLTDAFAREAVGFIDRHQKDTFFLYAPFNAPHTPLQATKKYLDRFSHIKDERRRVYASMVSALDDAVGAILNKLKETGLEKNTLVVFLSDNGCATYTNACTNDPLRYGKLTHLEGGFRIPFAMKLPGKIKPGSVYKHPVTSLDLLPTFLAIAGGELPKDRPYDGLDLMPYLTGKKKASAHEVLCWRNGANAAVRKGNWKLFKTGDNYFLFDLSKDIGELKDMAKQYPQIVEDLQKELKKWEVQTAQPLWPCRKAEGDWKFEGIKLDICI